MVSKKASKVAAEGVCIDGVRVKARRGEATDSHSLAERARREKISGRMKFLQSLVPGCDQITGKARVLDEIIKYVQLLQNHVEYLAAKVAIVDLMTYDSELKTSINPLELNLKIPQRECCLEPQIPLPVPVETSSVQYRSSAPSTSASVLLTEDPDASLITQDDGNYLLDMNDQYFEDIGNEPHQLDGSCKIKAN